MENSFWLIFCTAEWNDTTCKFDLWISQSIVLKPLSTFLVFKLPFFLYHCLTAKLTTLLVEESWLSSVCQQNWDFLHSVPVKRYLNRQRSINNDRRRARSLTQDRGYFLLCSLIYISSSISYSKGPSDTVKHYADCWQHININLFSHFISFPSSSNRSLKTLQYKSSDSNPFGSL